MTGPVGVDLGGQSVRACVAVDGRVARRSVARDLSVDDVIRLLGEVVDDAQDGSPSHPSHVVVAIPSFVDADGRVMHCPAVPALTGVPLGSLLEARLSGTGVALVPDLAAATTGEAAYGVGRGVDRFLCVALGTGANAAMVVEGTLVETAFGCLGDAGHVLVEPEGPQCVCGGRGCLEAVASGRALAHAGLAHGFDDAAAVGAAADEGDPHALALLRRAGIALGRAISTWSVMLWPDVVAVAGGVASSGELLLGPARAELLRVGPPDVTSRITVEQARLGERATVVGALHLASQHARSA